MRSTGLHITGRKPRYSAPFSRNLPISPAMAASEPKSKVALGLGQAATFFVVLNESVQYPLDLKLSYFDTFDEQRAEQSVRIESAGEVHLTNNFERLMTVEMMQILHNKIRLANANASLEDVFLAQNADLMAEIVRLSVKHQILSDFTSFICVGNRPGDE